MKDLLQLVELFGQGPRSDVNVRAERTKPYGLKPSPEGASFFQHGGSAPCYVCLIILLALLPSLAIAAPPLSPPAPQSWGEKGVVPQPLDFAQGRGWGERGAVARQNATLRVEPAQSVVDVGETFTITVMIDEASDLGGFEFTLFFVTTTVTVDSVTLGDFPGSTGRTAIPIGPTIDNQAGVVDFAVATVGADPGPGGTGELAVIGLTAQGAGSSLLDLQDVLVLNTKAEYQTTTIEDGTVVAGDTPPPVSIIYLPVIMKLW